MTRTTGRTRLGLGGVLGQASGRSIVKPRELEFHLAGRTLQTKGALLLAAGQRTTILSEARQGIRALQLTFLLRSGDDEYFEQNEYPRHKEFDHLQPLTRDEAAVCYCELECRFVEIPKAFPKKHLPPGRVSGRTRDGSSEVITVQ